jgi:NitT/TauT family transport system permease protein
MRGEGSVYEVRAPCRAVTWLHWYGPTLFLIATILLAWEAVQSRSGVAQYALPTPTTIARALIENRQVLFKNVGSTLFEAIGGFVLGNGLATIVAVGFVYSRPVEEMFYPVAVALRSIPLVAITPVLVVWFGPGYASKIAIVALITFFPTLVNMVQGLASVEMSTLELMHTLNASERDVFFKVRLPSSLPYFFASLRIAPSASVLGAIVAEWIGSTSGLGYVVLQAMWNFDVGRLWAAMVVATLLSVSAFLAVLIAERLAIPWHSSVRGSGEGESW